MWVEGFKREESVWEVKRLKTIERDRGEMKKNLADPSYRKVIKLDRSRGVDDGKNTYLYRIQNICNRKFTDLFHSQLIICTM